MRKTKIKGIKIERGIKVKACGLTDEEKRMVMKVMLKAIRKIEYRRREAGSRCIPYSINLNSD